MPIYEFYCSDCHTLFNFFSPVIDTESRPSCPRCNRPGLERRPARFATLKHQGEEEPDPFGQLDESKLEGFMDSMMEEMGDLDENEDPRQLASIFRRFGEASGLEFGPKMEEFMSRLEAGEDPEHLEEEMEGELDDEDALAELFRLKQSGWRANRRPQVDETLYFL
jgi:putative FmdB family regulatory protein